MPMPGSLISSPSELRGDPKIGVCISCGEGAGKFESHRRLVCRPARRQVAGCSQPRDASRTGGRANLAYRWRYQKPSPQQDFCSRCQGRSSGRPRGYMFVDRRSALRPYPWGRTASDAKTSRAAAPKSPSGPWATRRVPPGCGNSLQAHRCRSAATECCERGEGSRKKGRLRTPHSEMGETSKELIREILAADEDVRLQCVGAILNGVDMGRIRQYQESSQAGDRNLPG